MGTVLPYGPRAAVKAKVGPDDQLNRGNCVLLSSAGLALERKECVGLRERGWETSRLGQKPREGVR